MAITEDASTPAAVRATGSASQSVTTASFSPPANSLLVAIVTGGFNSAGTPTVTVSDSGSNTWTAGPKSSQTGNGHGVAQLFYTYLSSAPGSMTVTATFSVSSAVSGRQLVVKVLNGAAADQTGAATATNEHATTSTDATVSITTTITGSRVYGASNSSIGNDAFTANAATSIVDNWGNGSDFTHQVAWKASSDTVTPGATALGGTWASAQRSSNAALEILPAGGGGSPPAVPVYPISQYGSFH